MQRSRKALEYFTPTYWRLREGEGGIYSLRSDHGINSSFLLYNVNDPINRGIPEPDKVLLGYRINENRYTLARVGDFDCLDDLLDKGTYCDLIGNIAERVARRITKYYLVSSDTGINTKGLYGPDFDRANADGYVVCESGDLRFQVDRYPNHAIVRSRPGQGDEILSEIDGFFSFSYAGQRNLLVLEVKLETIKGLTKKIWPKLFEPLSCLFPGYNQYYLLFSGRDSILRKRTQNKTRQVTPQVENVYHVLKQHDVTTLAFSFNERKDEFHHMTRHVISQLMISRGLPAKVRGRLFVSGEEIIFQNGTQNALVRLRRTRDGLWVARGDPIYAPDKSEPRVPDSKQWFYEI
jgi:hypothetical protein